MIPAVIDPVSEHFGEMILGLVINNVEWEDTEMMQLFGRLRCTNSQLNKWLTAKIESKLQHECRVERHNGAFRRWEFKKYAGWKMHGPEYLRFDSAGVKTRAYQVWWNGKPIGKRREIRASGNECVLEVCAPGQRAHCQIVNPAHLLIAPEDLGRF